MDRCPLDDSLPLNMQTPPVESNSILLLTFKTESDWEEECIDTPVYADSTSIPSLPKPLVDYLDEMSAEPSNSNNMSGP